MPGEKDKGDETEHLIGKIAESIVLRDFVIRNPKFKKQSGKEKELTDILVPFGESIISIFVRSWHELLSRRIHRRIYLIRVFQRFFFLSHRT